MILRSHSDAIPHFSQHGFAFVANLYQRLRDQTPFGPDFQPAAGYFDDFNLVRRTGGSDRIEQLQTPRKVNQSARLRAAFGIVFRNTGSELCQAALAFRAPIQVRPEAGGIFVRQEPVDIFFQVSLTCVRGQFGT